MSDSFHGDKRLPAERPLEKPYPYGERFDKIQAYLRGQADAHAALAAVYANNDLDDNARYEFGFAAGVMLSVTLHDNAHEQLGDKK